MPSQHTQDDEKNLVKQLFEVHCTQDGYLKGRTKYYRNKTLPCSYCDINIALL